KNRMNGQSFKNNLSEENLSGSARLMHSVWEFIKMIFDKLFMNISLPLPVRIYKKTGLQGVTEEKQPTLFCIMIEIFRKYNSLSMNICLMTSKHFIILLYCKRELESNWLQNQQDCLKSHPVYLIIIWNNLMWK